MAWLCRPSRPKAAPVARPLPAIIPKPPRRPKPAAAQEEVVAKWGTTTGGSSDDATGGGTTLKKQPVEGGCEGCGVAHDGSYASGRFCSKPCAARNAARRKWHGDQSPPPNRHAQKKPKKRGKKRKKRSAETDSAESAKPPRSAPRERAVPKPKKQRRGSSRFVGVTFLGTHRPSATRLWRANPPRNGNIQGAYLGEFEKEEDAARAFDAEVLGTITTPCPPIPNWRAVTMSCSRLRADGAVWLPQARRVRGDKAHGHRPMITAGNRAAWPGKRWRLNFPTEEEQARWDEQE